jgi:glycosyltransferase involved in cell wall biosynthesis
MDDTYLIITGDFVKTGGMDRANYALADYLARQGATVHLVACRVDAALLAYPNVQFHRVPKPANSYLLAGPLLDYIGQKVAQQVTKSGGKVIVNGGNCLWRGAYNWVHYVHAVYGQPITGSWLRRLKQKLDRWQNRRTERHAFHKANLLLANSQRTKADLSQHFAIPDAKIAVAYLGVEAEIFYPPTQAQRADLRQKMGWSNTPVLLFVGDPSDHRKGFDTLAQAWQQLQQQASSNGTIWPVQLAIAGANKGKIDLAALGMIDLGFRRDLAMVLRAADGLVSPTRYESYGLGVHEALCCGLPAIVAATAGVAERYTAPLTDLCLNDANNPDELAIILQRWYNAQDYYRQEALILSEQLRQRTWDVMAAEMVQIME